MQGAGVTASPPRPLTAGYHFGYYRSPAIPSVVASSFPNRQSVDSIFVSRARIRRILSYRFRHSTRGICNKTSILIRVASYPLVQFRFVPSILHASLKLTCIIRRSYYHTGMEETLHQFRYSPDGRHSQAETGPASRYQSPKNVTLFSFGFFFFTLTVH